MTSAFSPLLPTHDASSIDRDLSHLPRTTSALLFHTTGGVHLTELAMVTAHTVEHDDAGRPHLAAGRPITPADERRILDLLQGRAEGQIEILPQNVLARSAELLMWWLPPSVRPMYLKNRKTGRNMKIDTRWPNLVLLVIGRTLYVAAVEGNERPGASSQLFHSPTPNVFSDARVCTGSAKLPSDSSLETMDQWVSVLADTYWTHDNHADTMAEPKRKARSSKTMARTQRRPDEGQNTKAGDYWASRSGDQSPFPDKLLIPLGMTLADWPVFLTTGQRSGGRRVRGRANVAA